MRGALLYWNGTGDQHLELHHRPQYRGSPITADPDHNPNNPGKGRGVVAQKEMRPGDLVMAVQPVVILHGPQGAMPPPDALVGHLKALWPTMTSQHRTAVRQMFAGSTTPATTSEGRRRQATDYAAWTESTASTAAGDAAAVDFQAVVSYNAYGDEYEDLPSADLRGGGPPRSHVGIWPHFCTLNHACAPNCVHYVVDSTMVVRAVQPIAEGTELLISYLGREDFAPRQVRQAALQSRYGFTCDCARCRTEAELPEELQALLLELYERARHELAPRFERLVSAASAEAERLDGGGAPYDGHDDDDDNESAEDDVRSSVDRADGSASPGAAAAAAGPGSKLSVSSLAAAEVAKRSLRSQTDGFGAPQRAGAQLASLEQRLEECARQLHLAVHDLQEDDEACEGMQTPSTQADGGQQLPPGQAAAGMPLPAAVTGSGRQLTRVQTAQAAAYQLLELLHLHAELAAAAAAGTGGGTTVVGDRAKAAAAGALQACWHVLDAISRGSELQVFQACKLLNDALRASGYSGSGSSSKGGDARAARRPQSPPAAPPSEVREAAALLGQSLVARYGPLRGEQLTKMTQAAIRASRGFF
ncbi:hypothetical protein Vretimale_14286 [Volvox reticuliferus]|uniref:SET domain-containing protein n=1 Tax=Volvox reticuliferus TaxID=1737510 RepID=A0A8J4LUM1_9CHLO|nr:hypothetical protein Vretifemale_15306 [Volvox reticuliferus]GIM10713.1 hypothetical protein Vretimale_14286 [Volvox reticuliferus]